MAAVMTEVGNQQVGAPSGSVPTQDAPFSQTQAFEPVVPANPNPVVGKIRLKQGEKEWLIRQDDRNDMMIGRNQLACQIVIKDPRVSSKHCRIFRDKTGFSLEEMSQNGTFVNGQRMAKEEVQPLQNGDDISLVVDPTMESDDPSLQPFAIFTLWVADSYQVKNRCLKRYVKGSFHEHYDIRDDLGSGNFSQVKLAVARATGREFAVKCIERRKFEGFAKNRNTCLTVDSEHQVLRQLEAHPHVVRLHDTVAKDGDPTIYLVMEFMAGGDLLNYILDNGPLREERSRQTFAELVSAVTFLHGKGIIHRDIKPENILLTAKAWPFHAKITDFGLARYMQNNQIVGTFCGTPAYFAPEIITTHNQKSEGYSLAVDIWSLGVVLYIMLSAQPPFNEDRLYEEICQGSFDFDGSYWPEVSDDAKSLIRRLMAVDAAKRITLSEVSKSSWMCTDRPKSRSEAAEPVAKRLRVDDTG
jgi:hypothetical protein